MNQSVVAWESKKKKKKKGFEKYREELSERNKN